MPGFRPLTAGFAPALAVAVMVALAACATPAPRNLRVANISISAVQHGSSRRARPSDPFFRAFFVPARGFSGTFSGKP